MRSAGNRPKDTDLAAAPPGRPAAGLVHPSQSEGECPCKERKSFGRCRARLGGKYDDYGPPPLSNGDHPTAQCAVRQTA